MAKVQVEWLGPSVDVPALDKTIHPGDTVAMEEAEARDRQDAGQVRIINDSEDVARATPRKKREEEKA